MAQLLDGKAVAKVLKEEVREEIAKWKEKGVQPKLAVILVGDDPASVVYARSKQKVAEGMGMAFELFTMPSDTPETDILKQIDLLNNDKDVHGIMIELPLPKGISKNIITSAV